MGGPPAYDPLLLASTPFALHRRPNDRFWGIALIALYAGCLLCAGVAYKNMNPEFFNLTESYLNDPKNCPVNPPGRNLLQLQEDAPPKFDATDFFSHTAAWLVVSTLASLAVAVGFLHLVRHHAISLAKFTVGFQLAVPTFICFAALLSGNASQGLLAGVFAALTFAVFYYWRNEIGVASKLLSVAGHGLAGNAALIGLTIALNLIAVILALPLLVGTVLGFADGEVVPNPVRQGREACVDEFGDGVMCCAWQPRPWAMLYIAMTALAATWTMLTANQIRVYVVSGTIAQWYFSPPGAPAAGYTSRSLRHALTTSFGTNAFAGLILTFTSAVQQQANQDQQNGNLSIFSFLASCLASIYEYLTKFATVFAAISGDALTTAGRKVTDLLARNALTAFATTIWFPSAVLTLASVTLSALWGSTVWGAYRGLHGADGELYPSTNAVVLGATVGVVSLFVLSFMSGVLLSVLDAVFVCFALDKDRQTVANAEMYEALLDVAEERGVLVHGPDGELGFGAAPYSPPHMAR